MYLSPVACLIIGIVIGLFVSLVCAIIYGAINYENKGDK